jgi:galactokinase/mevalonate kinase-like predicted kinase
MGLAVQASAPARCGIVGNPSDIYGGKVLSCSVPVRATCRLETSSTNQLPEDGTLWRAATARLPISEPVKVTWTTDVPRSSGLAGSTALLTATVLCLLEWRKETLSAIEIAELVRDIERNEAGIVCGFQDAYMAVHGGLHLMDFSGKGPRQPGPPGSLTSLDASLPFLLVTTGIERLSGSVHGPMSERWLAGEPLVLSSIERIGQLAEVGAEALISGNLDALAEAMNENQHLIAQLGGSGEAIDRLIEDCRKSGAFAAKLAGAGMGGTVITLTENAAELEANLRAKGYTRFLAPKIVPGARIERLAE